MSNVLTGIIQITAPGAQAAFDKVAGGARNTESAIQSLGTKLKTNASNFTIIGEAGQLTGSRLRSLTGVLNTTASTIPVLTQTTKAAGSSMLSFGASLLTPHTAILLLVGAIAPLISGLFGSASAFDKASVAAKIFKDNLDKVAEASDRLKGFLDLQNKIADLKFRIGGGEGAAADISNFKNQIQSNNTVIKDATKNLNDFNKVEDKLIDNIKKFSDAKVAIGGDNPLAKLALLGKDLNRITKEEADKLDGPLKSMVNQFIENRKAIVDEDKKLTEVRGAQSILQLQIAKAGVDEQKRLNDLSKTNYEKYVNEIIASAKKYQSALGKGIDVQLKIAFNDTKQEEFQKSLDYLSRINAGKFTFVIKDPKIKFEDVESPKLPGAGVTGAAPGLYELESANASKSFTARTAEDWANWLNLDALGRALLENQTKLDNAAKTLGKSFSDSLNTALSEGLSAIGEVIGNLLSGQNFGDQFGQVFGNLLEQMGKALIKFGIVKTGIDAIIKNFKIPGAVAIGLGIFAIAAGKLVKNLSGARALGGPVGAGGTYLVGENGPELFTPNTGGQITPNNWLGGGGVSGGGMMVQVAGEFIQRGQDLIAVITLANQSKGRLI